MDVRIECLADIEAIEQVNFAAFNTEAEAKLVNGLRDEKVPGISLVAENDGEIVGHILFTEVTLQHDSSDLKLMGLAPMAVLPEQQKNGVGKRLVKAGLAQCRAQGCDGVFVLGHPGYYPKFGFLPAVKHQFQSELDVPDEVFMLLELSTEKLSGKQGIIQFHRLFAGV